MVEFIEGVVVGGVVVLLAPALWARFAALPYVKPVVDFVKGLFAPKA